MAFTLWVKHTENIEREMREEIELENMMTTTTTATFGKTVRYSKTSIRKNYTCQKNCALNINLNKISKLPWPITSRVQSVYFCIFNGLFLCAWYERGEHIKMHVCRFWWTEVHNTGSAEKCLKRYSRTKWKKLGWQNRMLSQKPFPFNMCVCARMFAYRLIACKQYQNSFW